MGAGCVQLSERSKDEGWMNGSSSILYTIAQPGFSPVIYNAHGHARGHSGCASSEANLDAGMNGAQSRGYDRDRV